MLSLCSSVRVRIRIACIRVVCMHTCTVCIWSVLMGPATRWQVPSVDLLASHGCGCLLCSMTILLVVRCVLQCAFRFSSACVLGLLVQYWVRDKNPWTCVALCKCASYFIRNLLVVLLAVAEASHGHRAAWSNCTDALLTPSALVVPDCARLAAEAGELRPLQSTIGPQNKVMPCMASWYALTPARSGKQAPMRMLKKRMS